MTREEAFSKLMNMLNLEQMKAFGDYLDARVKEEHYGK